MVEETMSGVAVLELTLDCIRESHLNPGWFVFIGTIGEERTRRMGWYMRFD